MVQLGVSYFGNRFVSHAREDLKRIASCCDYVLHTVSEADLHFHKSVVSKIIGETKKLGLEVWADPWALGGVFGGEALSRFLVDHRDSWQVMSDGRPVPSACLNRAEWRSFVKEWILTVRDMGADVMFWDEPHIAFDFQSELEGVYSCICPVCQEKYKKRFGVCPPSRLNPDAHTFRRETVKSFLNEIMEFSKEQKLRNALCLYAFKGHEEYDHLWKEAVALKDLDIFGCDPYWRWRGKHNPDHHVGEYAKYVLESASPKGKGSQIWIQAMRLPAGAEGEIHEACEAASREGVSHIAAWSFDGGEILDPVLAERPEKVWQAVEASYKRIRGI